MSNFAYSEIDNFDSNFDSEEFDNFFRRSKFNPFRRNTLFGKVVNRASRLGSNIPVVGKFGNRIVQGMYANYEGDSIPSNVIQFDSFDNFDEEFDGFRKLRLKKLNPFQRHTVFGKIVGKAANLAQVIPGAGGIAGSVVQGLFNKGEGQPGPAAPAPAEIQAAPAAAIQAANTPAAAAQVVQTLAPSLPPQDRAAAAADVMNASTPFQAAAVAGAMANANKKEKSKKRWILIASISGGVLLVTLLIIFLAKRK